MKPPIPETPREEQIFKAALNTRHTVPSPETKKFMEKIDLKFQYMQKDIKEIKENMVTKDSMDLANEKLVERIFEKVKSEYVSKTEFAPIKKVIYGIISIVGTAIIGAVIYSVLK